MRTRLRRVRAALVVSAAWAVAWGTVALLIRTTHGTLDGLPDVTNGWLALRYLGLTFRDGALIGGAAGLMFAGALAAAERGRTTVSLPAMRIVGWGAFAGSGLLALAHVALKGFGAATTTLPLAQLGLAAMSGATLAALTLRLARRAARGAVSTDAARATNP